MAEPDNSDAAFQWLDKARAYFREGNMERAQKCAVKSIALKETREAKGTSDYFVRCPYFMKGLLVQIVSAQETQAARGESETSKIIYFIPIEIVHFLVV